MQSPQKKLEGLKNNLDLLLSKGLTEWMDKRIEEIISQNEGSNLTKTEAQWLMAQSKNIQGDTINAERYFQEAWQNLTTSTDIKDTEREELLRLIGLNYARF
jgi:nitrogen fixation/metabolism regulation signal transduction histidine kinase